MPWRQTDVYFANLLAIALQGRVFTLKIETELFGSATGRRFEVAEVRDDGRVRLKPSPMADATETRGDLILPPSELVPAR